MRELLVWAVLFYLRFWARIALKIHRPYIIGVAGSVGKSSTRNALHAVLKDHFTVKVVSGNSETGVPLGILGITIEGFNNKNWLTVLLKAPRQINSLKNTQYLIVEMGIDDPYPPKNMTYLLTIVKPDMAIDLNATATHTQQFEKVLKKHTKDTLDFILGKIAEEDSKIITNGYTKVGIYNNDDARLKSKIDPKAKKESVILLTFGQDKTNTIYYLDYQITTKKTKFTYGVTTSKGERVLEVAFPGMILPPASKESFGAVILAAHALGLKYTQIIESLTKNFTIPKGRSSVFSGIKGSLIIDSSYNSSKSTVLSFLDLLLDLKKRTGRAAVFLMGDMRELGNEARGEHEEVAHKIAEVVDQLYCVGSITQEYVVPIVKRYIGRKNRTKKVEWYKNAVQAGLHMKEELPKDAIILVKGSQNTLYLEEAIKFLLENQNDVKFLTRQEDFWLKTKQEFFSI